MPFDEHLATRMREIIARASPDAIEKSMFGGLAFMLQGKMFAGIVKDELMVRCIAERYDELLQNSHCKEMKFTGKPMKGFLFVEPEGLANEEDLTYWLMVGYEFVEKTPEKKKK